MKIGIKSTSFFLRKRGEILKCGNRVYKKQFWFNEEEVLTLKDKAFKAGMNESDFIRRMLLGYKLKEKPDKEFYESIKLLRNVANNLNQIAKKANTLNYIDEVAYKKETDRLHNFITDIKDKFLINRI